MQMTQDQFDNEVLPAELREIAARRRQRTNADEATDKAAPNSNLSGLALSGGGIRSAVFSLGVIQELVRRGVLEKIDYLSTVSGGGYIGGCVSSLLNTNDAGTTQDSFPLARGNSGATEPAAMQHLRNSSNYLSPGGVLNAARLPNLLVRGVTMNLFVLLPYIMAATFFTELAYERGPHWDNLPALLVPLGALFLIAIIVFPVLLRLFPRWFRWEKRDNVERLLGLPLLFAFGILVAIPLLRLTRLTVEHSWVQVFDWFDSLDPLVHWKLLGAVAAGLIILGIAGKASATLSTLRSKIVLVAVGLLGPLFVLVVYLGLCLWQIDSPFVPAGSAKLLNVAAQCESPCLAEEGSETRHIDAELGDVLERLVNPDKTPITFEELTYDLKGRNIILQPGSTVSCESGNCAVEPEDWREDSRVWLVTNASEQYRLSRASERSLRIEGAALSLFSNARDYIFLGVFVGLLIFNRLCLNANVIGPHGFYRDRLARAFLIRQNPDNTVVPNDDQLLSKLNAEAGNAPYHLINVALNLQGCDDRSLRGRACDFFTFSKRYVGSDRTGYSKTEEMEQLDSGLTLGTAVAISGAAAAPNMGSQRVGVLSFLLCLLNIRLGYWLPNPAKITNAGFWRRLRLGSAAPRLIWREAMGRLDDKGTHVNLSDGGHIENLALYGLLRRRCSFIICVDGEADPEMTFGGLVTLQRYASIDLGVDIKLDLEPLRKSADGLSACHHSLGTITYDDGSVGQLLYIKLSVTGDEPEYVRSYRAHNPEFPHQTTADQFFSEEQFEVYRGLGSHAMMSAFESFPPGAVNQLTG